MSEDGQRDYSMIMPFWIDTPGYTDRDRKMFVCGVEFQMIYESVKAGQSWNQCIHNENVDRVRMMLAKFGRRYKLVRHCDTWTNLETEPTKAEE